MRGLLRPRPARRLAVVSCFAAALLCAGPSGAGTITQAQRPSVAPVLRAVTPGVVNIAVRKVEKVDSPLLQDPVIRELFDIPDRELKRESRSAGSGVIVDAGRGYVLTNDHVVRGASNIEVTTKDNRRFKARVVGRDPATDIAVLQIPPDNLVAVPMGDSDRLEVGDFVLAIGNPFGLGQTVTSGIISALGRTGLGIEGYEDFIQTDASINPGNSGGALVTLDGRLAGINTAIISKTGGNVGIGFAVPINMAKAVMEQLVAHGEVRRGRIGVTLRDTGTGQGALIENVEPQSPAARAGLARGDVVTAVNGTAIRSAGQLRNTVGLLPAGREIELRYRRGGESFLANVRIEPTRSSGLAGRAGRN